MRYEMAEALVRSQAYSDAAPYLRGLLAKYPKNARLHLLLGIVLREKGVLAAAEQEIRLAIRLRQIGDRLAKRLGKHGLRAANDGQLHLVDGGEALQQLVRGSRLSSSCGKIRELLEDLRLAIACLLKRKAGYLHGLNLLAVGNSRRNDQKP